MAGKSRRASKAPEPKPQSWLALTKDRITPLSGLVASVMVIIAAFAYFWNSLGGLKPVDHDTLRGFKQEVETRFTTTKVEVIAHADRKSEELKVLLGKLSKDVSTNTLEGIEAQLRTAQGSRRVELESNLAGIERQIKEIERKGKPADTVLIERRAWVQAAIKNNETQVGQLQERIRRMKEGQ